MAAERGRVAALRLVTVWKIWETDAVAGRSTKPVQRRRGRPAGGGQGARSALMDAALALMDEQPWQRVSAKAVADAAGCDPALVTYHFGGRDGLLHAVGERAALMLRERMRLGYADAPDLAEALRQSVLDPATAMVDHPLLGQLYVGELLLHGEVHTDVVLHDMAVPYFEEIQTALDRGDDRHVQRPIDRGVLLYTLASLSLFPFFLGPMRSRGSAQAEFTRDPIAFSAALFEVLLSGALTASAQQRAAHRRRAKATGSGRGVALNAVTQEELVLAAIELLRTRAPADVDAAAVAAATGHDEALVKRYFPTSVDLMGAVAQSASRMLPQPTAAGSRRGRPATENSDVERRLIVAALELAAESASVSVRSVAMRAGCDPALVTYYFGGRRGLLQEVAARTVGDLVSRFEGAWQGSGFYAVRLAAALEAVVAAVVHQPTIAQLVMDDFLVRGDKKSDAALAPIVSRYWKQVREIVDTGLAEGDLRPGDPEALRCVVGLLPVFVGAAIPLLHRALRGPVVAGDPERRSREIVNLVLGGIFVDPGPGRSALSGRGSGQKSRSPR